MIAQSMSSDEDGRVAAQVRAAVREEIRVITDHERPEWLTTHQVANLLMICSTSLEKARSTGRGPLATIPHFKLGRTVRYRRSDVATAVARLRVPGRTPKA